MALTLISIFLLSALTVTQITNLVIAQTSNSTDAGDTLAASPHSILIESPNNHTIYGDSLTLNITVYFLETDGLVVWQSLTSLNYSIDNKSPMKIITNEALALLGSPVNSDNITVFGLADGQHQIQITAVFVGNVGNVFLPTYTLTSAPVYFTVNTEPPPKPTDSPATLGFIASVGIAVAVIGWLAYFKKRKRDSRTKGSTC